MKTPSGRIGKMVKYRGTQSRHDLFQRIIIKFDETIGDSVALQKNRLMLDDFVCFVNNFEHVEARWRPTESRADVMKV